MALSERSRSELYGALSALVSQEAVGEMLSYFPSRDVEEPVTKEFFRADMAIQRADLVGQMAGLRTELINQMSDLRTDLTNQMGQLRTDLTNQMSDLRTDVTAQMSDLRTDVTNEMAYLRADLTGQISEIRGEMRALKIMAFLNVTLLISLATLMTMLVM